MNRHIVATRESLCRKCATPCETRPDVRDPCSACPIDKWRTFRCQERGLGDDVAAAIERRVLTPAEKHVPAVVAAVRKCGGCMQAKHALGSAQKHPDPGTVV